MPQPADYAVAAYIGGGELLNSHDFQTSFQWINQVCNTEGTKLTSGCVSTTERRKRSECLVFGQTTPTLLCYHLYVWNERMISIAKSSIQPL